MEVTLRHTLLVFNKILDTYMHQFFEFYAGLEDPFLHPKFKNSHPQLNSTVDELQIAFCDLPEKLQSRLLSLDISLLLSASTDSELYNLRAFIYQNNISCKFKTFLTVLGHEITLAQQFINQEKMDRYDYLPVKDFSYDKLLKL
ncbi:hypothetical protein IKE_06229 [Bacillus cereus VD196]|uniref:Uncharacterized protein n=1 Tax=Bacillus cereus VD196 TaxID=1053243 RepID=A0A9W5PXS0_BACCE|nr:hypothetical protein [Bacillus cereus]EJR89623.1 hypothetical protein IKG_06021 [Bacillus cereus VD200]EOO58614.1 hypothetical protein IKE_06229 [Bacillus cereus VD196]